MSGKVKHTVQSCPRGISDKKKKAILEKLGALMPSSRLLFYKDLPVSNAVDLQAHYDP